MKKLEFPNNYLKKIELVDVFITLLFILFFLFLIFSNRFDWDHFLSSMEADLRSWVVDHELPLWSYQFCSGVTRIGDPQSFGLSPLFIPIILFGSFWGSKILVFALSILGFYSILKIMSLLAGEFYKNHKYFFKILTATIIFSNFNLWQFHHGHLAFAPYFVGLYIVFNTLKVLDGISLTKIEKIIFVLAIWAHFSSGFYHSTMFFMFPFFIAIAVTLILKLKSKGSLLVIKNLMIFYVLGFLLSFYKLIFVWKYQQAFPRTVIVGTTESLTVKDFLLTHFVPTFDYKFLIGKLSAQVWGIWEYSIFSFGYLFVFLLFIFLLFNRTNILKSKFKSAEVCVFVWCIVSLLFCFGDFSPLAPFALFNKYIFKNSVRVIGRFGIGFTISFILLIPIFIKLIQRKKELFFKVMFGFSFFALIFLPINFYSFRQTLSFTDFKNIFELPIEYSDGLQVIELAKPRNAQYSYMYGPILNGHVVPNCYQPMTREIKFVTEYPALLSKYKLLPLIDNNLTPVSSDCFSKSYLTQNKIFIAPECPKMTCLNLNGKNIYQDQSELQLNMLFNKYCWYK